MISQFFHSNVQIWTEADLQNHLVINGNSLRTKQLSYLRFRRASI